MTLDRVRFDADADGRGGVTIVVDGHPQSHVDPADPGLLVFEYVQLLALVVSLLRPAAPTPVRATHVGGAGLTLARWIQHTRPGSSQIVLEPDAALTTLVRERLPLPRGHRIRVRPMGGREGVARLGAGSADLLVLDAYAAGRVPAELVTPAFLADVARALTPGAVLLANLADEPGLRYVARMLASIEAAGFGAPVILAPHEVLKGRRFGNVVVAAIRSAEDCEPTRSVLDSQALRRAVASAAVPTGIREGGEVSRLVAGARAFTDADAQPSPEPPTPGTWRLR